MKYRCKVLTDEFYRKVQNTLQELTDDLIGYNKLIWQKRYFADFLHLWNENSEKPILKTLEIDNPEYTEQIFDAQEKGFQSEPRILWLGEICKINDINQIFSYERID